MLTELTERERDCYEMKEMGRSSREIGETLGISKNAVRKAIARARKKLTIEEGDGVTQAMESMGVGVGQIRGGWLKSKEASIRFDIKEDNSDLDEEAKENIKEIIREAFKEVDRPEPVKAPPWAIDDLLAKYVFADVHMGMHSWAEECGEDYDLELAEEAVQTTAEQLIESTPPAETAIILNLGDWFHTNDSKNMTPMSGHILDVDGRFPKIAIAAVRTIKRAIRKALERHKKVIYVGIPGNHDKDQAHWLTISMMEAFADEPRVEVYWPDDNKNIRYLDWFCYTHGKVMLAAHHGDRAPFNRLALAMADNFSEQWGKTYVVLRSHRAIAAKDSYAAKSAYSSRRGATASVYHKERGEIMTNYANLYQGRLAR